MSAVAVVGAKLSNNQHKVDQAWDWLRRIWIAWAVINGIGAYIAYWLADGNTFKVGDFIDVPGVGKLKVEPNSIQGYDYEAEDSGIVLLPERVVFLDIGLPRLRLGIEVDGHEYHSVRSAFVHDRLRDAELAAHGWQIVRFPAALVLHEPGRFVALARAAIDQRRALM